jgi:N-dimethylarginine dimethylaminohydrolase
MVAFKIYYPGEVDFNVDDLHERPEPRKILMCTPTYFDVVDVKNAYMENQVTDPAIAMHQWNALKAVYDGLVKEGLLDELMVIDGARDCEDMVFCANQTFPWLAEDGTKQVVISKMRHPSRQREVPYFETWFSNLGYSPIHLAKANLFEGMGDTIPHSGKRLLYGGYGHRSDLTAYEELAALLHVPVVPLELVNPYFYHLDTCFVPLSEHEVMLCKDAFTETGLSVLEKLFDKIYYIPAEEAVTTFCLNAHVITGNRKTAILQPGSRHAARVLQDAGFRLCETDTSEFMKSGGSVFCMKMMVY